MMSTTTTAAGTMTAAAGTTTTTDTAPRLTILPEPDENLAREVTAAGGTLGPLSGDTTGLILSGRIGAPELTELLDRHPGIGWIQLPSAGVEVYGPALAAHPALHWTSAKGAFARPVAEHALALTLALLRRLPERVRATAWGAEHGTSLYGMRVVVLGAGGIGQEIVRLFKAFDTHVTVLRRGADAVPGADVTMSMRALRADLGAADAEADAELGHSLADVLAEADVVVLAAALTAETKKLIGARELDRMKRTSILVNIARGGLVDTDALVAALAGGALAGAALDVTDPEPLPDGHPLWTEQKALITPHTADTEEMVRPLIGARVRENVRRWAEGKPLQGLVDVHAGY
ncbi:NAD(P)-dependent oxidoreductase [Arthrobacter sp. A5]|uniref:NAD(P)-dependent oxidoreductase n=1 Tax=Arthrobacter sp. A5 TaxID=576926 RepID=UPI003DA8365F